ncbi:14607_t:CDS:2, partial [Entrophospora sp. SA101]
FQVSVNCQLNSDSPTYNFTVRKVGSCNLTLWENSPVLDQLDQLNGAIHNWPKVNITNVKRWMAYVKCDAPLMLKNITELDTSEAVILPYDYALYVSSLCPMCKADCTTWNIDESNNEDSKTPTTIITTTNSSTSSPIESRNNDHGAFPHFRWVKYLASIRKEGRRTSRLFRNSRGGS